MTIGGGGQPNPPWAELKFDTGCVVKWSEPGEKWAEHTERTVTVVAANGKIVTVDQKTGAITSS